ncbi:MAG: methyltransferase domain-containing protein [Acidimicrobiales bacterium]|nr:methyltransferase domain-containing protein [Acidimicrobiales bacterium]
MTDTSKVLRYLELAAARAESDDHPDLPPETEAIDHARRHLATAGEFAHAGSAIPDGARLRPVKQALVTGFRPVTSHQRQFNENLLAAVDGLTAAVERIARDFTLVQQGHNRVQASMTNTELAVDDVTEQIDRITVALEQVQHRLQQEDSLESARLEDIGARMSAVEAKQNLVFRTARQALTNGEVEGAVTVFSRELDNGHEELYQDLEDRFRGSRDHVRALVAEYLPDIESVPGAGPVVDVGCGRGEWLEVLRDASVESYGVDLNETVVQRCTDRGLDVRHGDALAHLREIPEGSVRAVTSFHLVEHLTLDTMMALLEAAYLALKPGGVLILETPNPTNIIVGASSFYLDPTHIKPVHPDFLQFLALSSGFVDAEIRYLHPVAGDVLEPEDLASHATDPVRARTLVDRINWALTGPMDYSVVARKAIPAEA